MYIQQLFAGLVNEILLPLCFDSDLGVVLCAVALSVNGYTTEGRWCDVKYMWELFRLVLHSVVFGMFKSNVTVLIDMRRGMTRVSEETYRPGC